MDGYVYDFYVLTMCYDLLWKGMIDERYDLLCNTIYFPSAFLFSVLFITVVFKCIGLHVIKLK